MSTTTVTQKPVGLLRPKYFVWTCVFLMIAYVLQHNERFLIDRSDPVWRHYEPFKWYLLAHGLAGACAIFLGPLQFWDKLRARHLKLHRVVGRFYIFGAMVLAPLGVYIQYFEERMGGTRSFTFATATDAALLMTTTGIAFYFALRRKITQHRQWMTRSYAVAVVFLEVRVIGGLGGWDHNPKAVETIVWICVGMSLLIGDILVQWQELRRTQPGISRSMAQG